MKCSAQRSVAQGGSTLLEITCSSVAFHRSGYSPESHRPAQRRPADGGAGVRGGGGVQGLTVLCFSPCLFSESVDTV